MSYSLVALLCIGSWILLLSILAGWFLRSESESDLNPQRGTEIKQSDQLSLQEVYRFHYTRYLHQDKLGWSRVQTLMTIEAAILAGAMHEKSGWSIILLLLGTPVVIGVYRLTSVRLRIGLRFVSGDLRVTCA
jgi:hypothetical protein